MIRKLKSSLNFQLMYCELVEILNKGKKIFLLLHIHHRKKANVNFASSSLWCWLCWDWGGRCVTRHPKSKQLQQEWIQPKKNFKNLTENKWTGIFTKSLGIFHRLGIKGLRAKKRRKLTWQIWLKGGRYEQCAKGQSGLVFNCQEKKASVKNMAQVIQISRMCTQTVLHGVKNAKKRRNYHYKYGSGEADMNNVQ